jgi:RNA polymerase sigma-70 factor (ECF subfamily)
MEQPAFDEQAAIAAAIRGDAMAFGLLVRACQQRAYAVAYSYLRNRDDALEAVQDAFVQAFRAMNRFEPGRPFYPWLSMIVRNKCLNQLKKRKRRGEQSLETLIDAGYDLPDPDAAADGPAQQHALQEQIRAALAQLSPQHREILRLRHLMELSYGEIAEALAIPPGTVMSRLHAARKALREVLPGDDLEGGMND